MEVLRVWARVWLQWLAWQDPAWLEAWSGPWALLFLKQVERWLECLRALLVWKVAEAPLWAFASGSLVLGLASGPVVLWLACSMLVDKNSQE